MVRRPPDVHHAKMVGQQAAAAEMEKAAVRERTHGGPTMVAETVEQRAAAAEMGKAAVIE